MESTLEHTEEHLNGVYSDLLFISLDPNVKAMNDESREYIQALFDHQWSRNRLSEVYVIERDFDGQQRPFMTFEHSLKNQSVDEVHSLENEEEEYQVHIDQIRRFIANPDLQALISHEISLYLKNPEHIPQRGLVYSVPIRYGEELVGIVAALIPTERIREELERGNYANMVILANDQGEIAGSLDLPIETRLWFQDQFDQKGGAEFFAEAPETFPVNNWKSLWTPVNITSDKQWWLVFQYDESVYLQDAGITGFSRRWIDSIGIFFGGLLLALFVHLTYGRLEDRVQHLQEQQKAKKLVQKSEEKYRAIFEQSKDAIYITTKEGSFVTVNQAAVVLFGYTKKELLKLDVRELYANPSDRERFQQEIERKGYLKEYELKLRKKDGIEMICLVSAIVQRDENGNIMGYQGILRDITEQKQTEEVIKSRDQELTAIFESTTDGILVVDNQGKVVHSNQPFAEMWRIPKDLIKKGRDEELLSYVLQQLKDPKSFVAKVRELYQSSEYDYDTILFKDGRVFDRHSKPWMLKDEIAGRVWIFRDITERKRSEQIQSVLLHIAQATSEVGKLEELLVAIQNELRTLFETRNFDVALYDKDNGSYHFTYSTDEYDDVDFTPEELSKSLTDYVRRTGNPLLVDEKKFDELVRSGEVSIVGTPSPIWMGAPLNTTRGVIGVVSVQSYTNASAYSENDLNLLSFVSKHIAIAIERKHAEEALNLQKTYFQQLFENSPQGIAIVDVNNRVVDINRGFEDLFQYSLDEIKGKHINHVIVPENLFEEGSGLSHTVLSGKTIQKETIRRRKDGSLIEVAILGYPIEFSNNQIGVYAIYSDITKRKLAEERLRKRTEQAIHHQMALRELAKQDYSDFLPALKRITEVASKTLRVERVSIWVFKEDKSEIICKELYIASKNLHDKAAGLKARDYPKYFKALNESRTVAADDARADHRTSEFTEGYLKPLGITSMMDVPIRLHGELVGVVCHEHTGPIREWTVEDQDFAASITDMVSLALEASERKRAERELKESERSFRELYDNATDAIYIQDKEGCFLDVNLGAVNMYGYPREFFIGKTPEFLSAPGKNDMKKIAGYIKKAFKGEPQQFEFWGKRKNGEVFPKAVRLNKSQYFGQDVIVAFAMDIIERKRAEKEREAFRRLSQRLIEPLSMSEIGHIVAEESRSLFHHDAFSLDLLDKEKEMMIGIYNEDTPLGKNEPQKYPASSFPLEKIRNREVLDGQPKLINRMEKPTQTSLYAFGDVSRLSRSLMFVPIVWKKQTIGVLSVQSYTPGRYGQTELELLQTFANQAGAALVREQVEDALRISEEKYRKVVESALDIIFRMDIDGNFTFLNIFAERITEYPRNELLEMNFEKLVHPEDQDFIRKLFQEQVKTQTKEINYGCRIITKSGKIVWISAHATLLMKDGWVVGWQSIARDITEQKQAEKLQASVYRISEATHSTENLDELFQTIHTIIGELMPAKNFYIALYDTDAEMINFPYFTDAYDDTPERKKLGKGITEYVLRTGKPIHATSEVLKDLVKKGEIELIGTLPVDWLGIPLKIDNTIIGLLAVQNYTEGICYTEHHMDILKFVSSQIAMSIQRKRAEEELRNMNESLLVANARASNIMAKLEGAQDELQLALASAKESDRLKSEFLANTSHELRTPLSSIIGFLKLIIDGLYDSTAEMREFLNNALDSSNHLLQLINDVLDLAKIESGVMETKFTTVNLQDILDDAYLLTHVQAERKNLDLNFSLVENGAILVKAVPKRLCQVLINLIGNSIKFTSQGKIEITGCVASDGKYAKIQVRDTGIGIPFDKQRKVFEKFVQADGSTSRKYGGSGLGLTITKSLVEFMGGNIELNSPGIGEGTTVSFTVPLEDQIQAAE